GVTPRSARRRSTPARTTASTFSATGLPSRITPAPAWSSSLADPDDVGGAARLGIDRDDHAVQRGGSLGRLEADGHLGEEALQDQILVHADDGVDGARHAEVGDVGGAAGQNALVGGLEVTMCADHRAYQFYSIPVYRQCTCTRSDEHH